jgi:hypothetical protein
MAVKTISEPILDASGKQEEINGRKKFTKSEDKQVTITPVRVDYLGNDMWKIKGRDENGDETNYEATTQSVKSFFDKEAIETIKSQNTDKKYSNNLISVKDYLQKQKTPTNTKPSGAKMSFPQWKQANPNGSIADYKKYKG